MKTFVIGEIASAHDGDLAKALRLVDVCADAGCNAAKAQFWSSADALADRRGVPAYYREIYRRYQIPRTWMDRLKMRCEERGIDFLCTAYLPEDIGFVAAYVKRFKISSFEMGDPTFLLQHAAFNKPIIASLGMMDARDWVALTRLRRDGRLPDVSWLHCVSAYPADPESMNLAVIRRYGLDGLSDHSACPIMGSWAVAAGARIVEVHVRLDDTDPCNPDFGCALSPEHLKDYVLAIRTIERAMGDGVKRLEPCEVPMAAYRLTSAHVY